MSGLAGGTDMLGSLVCLAGLAISASADETVAESVTLRDGRVLQGLIETDTTGGPVTMVVRRKWAAQNVPDLLAGWQTAEKAQAARAWTLRRARLETWKNDILTSGSRPRSRILTWIDQELAKPEPAKDEVSRLMAVTLERAEVRSVARKPEDSTRLLRAGWLADFDGPEEMSPALLTESLNFRGIDPARRSPIDVLLPFGSESNDRWLMRRAATEVANEPGLRFVDLAGRLMVDPTGTRNGGIQAMIAIPPQVASNRPTGPRPPSIAESLRQKVGSRGLVGAIVTESKPNRKGDAVTAEATLWFRHADGRWKPAGTTSATIRVADLEDEDLKVSGAFRGGFKMKTFEMTNVNGRIVRREKKVGDEPEKLGVAGRKAMTQVRTLMDADLANLALELD